jgi:hypothetical protein
MKTSLVDRGSVERLLLFAGAVRSGLIDALAAGGVLSVDEVAKAAGADPRASHIVLEALVAEDVVERVALDAAGGGEAAGAGLPRWDARTWSMRDPNWSAGDCSTR